MVWRPSLERVQVQQTLGEIDERSSVVHFCVATQSALQVIGCRLSVFRLTSFNFARFHVLSRHGIVVDNVWQIGGRKISLARLLLCAMLARILFHLFEFIMLPAKLVRDFFEEFVGLLAHLEHPCGWLTKHFGDSSHLVVLR